MSHFITCIHLSTSSPPFSTHFPCYHLYSPLHTITTILLPSTNDRPVSQSCHDRTPHSVSWFRSWHSFIPFWNKSQKLPGTRCGLYGRSGEMARCNCSIGCMAIDNFKEKLCQIIFCRLVFCAGKRSICIFLNWTNKCTNFRWVSQEIYIEQLEKQPLGRPTEGCKNSRTMYIRKTGSERQSWLELAHNIHWRILSVVLKLWNFLHIHIHICKSCTIMPPLYYLPPS